jgi:hypothetical protein
MVALTASAKATSFGTAQVNAGMPKETRTGNDFAAGSVLKQGHDKLRSLHADMTSSNDVASFRRPLLGST